VGEGMDLHIPKGYIYFAMSFSVFVEIMNMKMRKKKPQPLKLRNPRSAKIVSFYLF
jgi:predicted tellurium resistance membrane protein TerC